MAIDSTSFSALAQQAVLRSDEPQLRSLKVENFQQAVSFVRTSDANERAYEQAPALTQGRLRPTGDEFRSSTPFISAYAHLVFDRDGSANVDAIESGQVDTGQIVDEMQSGKSLIELADEFGLTVDELRTELENAGYDVKMSFNKGGLEITIRDPAGNHVMTVRQTLVPPIFNGPWVVDSVTYTSNGNPDVRDGDIVIHTTYSDGEMVEMIIDPDGVWRDMAYLGKPTSLAVKEGIAEGKTLEQIAVEEGMTVDELRAQIEQEKLFVIYSHEADGGVGYTIRMNDGSFVMSYTTSQFLLPS